MPNTTPQFDDALYRKLRTTCGKLAKGLELEDLTQAVAMRIVRNRLLERWCADRGSLDAYLYVVARSEALSLRRSIRRKLGRKCAWQMSEVQTHIDQHRATLRSLTTSAEGSGLRDLSRRVSPNAARLLALLMAGSTNLAARKEIGHRAYIRAYRELKETVRADSHAN